ALDNMYPVAGFSCALSPDFDFNSYFGPQEPSGFRRPANARLSIENSRISKRTIPARSMKYFLFGANITLALTSSGLYLRSGDALVSSFINERIEILY